MLGASSLFRSGDFLQFHVPQYNNQVSECRNLRMRPDETLKRWCVAMVMRADTHLHLDVAWENVRRLA